jgi:hypothetical protein
MRIELDDESYELLEKLCSVFRDKDDAVKFSLLLFHALLDRHKQISGRFSEPPNQRLPR